MIQFAFTDGIPINDRDYFTDMYLHYEAIMYSTARKFINNTESVEDVVQDSVEKLIKKIAVLNCSPSSQCHLVKHQELNHLNIGG